MMPSNNQPSGGPGAGLSLRVGLVAPLLIMAAGLAGAIMAATLLGGSGMGLSRIVPWFYFVYAMILIGGAEELRRRSGLDYATLGIGWAGGSRPYLIPLLAVAGLVGFFMLLDALVPIPEILDTREVIEPFLDDGKLGFLGILTAALLIGFLIPVGEEFLFRGFILHALVARMPPQRAVTITAAIFACCHVYAWLLPLGAGLYTMLQIFALAWLLGWATLRSGSLGPAILAHCINNLAAIAFALAGY